MELKSTIEKYLDGIPNDEFHRYKSWDNCHQAFNTKLQTDQHTLELAFYLASWGMYRGSGGLLQKNHLVHKGAVDILFLKESQKLKCNDKNEVTKSKIKDILNLKKRLAHHYSNIYYTKGIDDPKPISATDTLLSKILLGTLGCVPAYDQYFIKGLKEKETNRSKFNEASLNELFAFIDDKYTEIKAAQQIVLEKTKNHYPIMKILDMYFWQTGYDKAMKEKKDKNI